MAREIIIDTDTLIGYDYQTKLYYIKNKDTITNREDAKNTKDVLDIVAPSNNIPLNDLEKLASEYEPLRALYYTWDNTGAYIKTIQINTYKDYPMVVDMDKSKLYVMNSSIIFDLALDENKRSRLLYMQSFYHDILGLQLSLPDLAAMYDILISFYAPTVYNTIITPNNKEEALKYSNIFKLSNYNNTSKAEYTCTINPNNKSRVKKVANISKLEENYIYLASPIPIGIHVGDTLTIKNAVTVINGYDYYSDGAYTIVDLLYDKNVIQVNNNFPAPYTYTPPVLYIEGYSSVISKVERDTRTITLTNPVPDSLLIGDTITVVGTTITTPYETLTIDGTYTIYSIEGNTIVTEESIPTNYTYTEGTQPYLYKSISVGNINTINDTTITLEDTPPFTLTNNTKGYVLYPDDTKEALIINTMHDNIVTIYNTVTAYTPSYGIIEKDVPIEEVLIEVSNSKRSYVFPNTKFMVDNYNQCTTYIKLLNTLQYPTDVIYNRINQKVEETYNINTSTVHEMELLGLYDEYYEDKNLI